MTVILASCRILAGTDRTPKNTSKLASDSRLAPCLCCGSDSLTLSPEHFWQTQTQCLRNALSKDTKCLLISTAKLASGSSRLDSRVGSSRGRTRRFFPSCSNCESSCIASSNSRPRLPRRMAAPRSACGSRLRFWTVRRRFGNRSFPCSSKFCSVDSR